MESFTDYAIDSSNAGNHTGLKVFSCSPFSWSRHCPTVIREQSPYHWAPYEPIMQRTVSKSCCCLQVDTKH